MTEHASQGHQPSQVAEAAGECAEHAAAVIEASRAEAADTIAAAAARAAQTTQRPANTDTSTPTPTAFSQTKIQFSPKDELTTTLIAASQTIKGTIEGPEGVIVKGRVDGNILVDDTGPAGTGTIVIYAGGVVNGIVSGRRVIVFGTVNGPIISRTNLTIAETGVVNGDVHYRAMSNNEGGVIEGRMQRMKDDADPLPELLARGA